jgi:hypothetical protein
MLLNSDASGIDVKVVCSAAAILSFNCSDEDAAKLHLFNECEVPAKWNADLKMI